MHDCLLIDYWDRNDKWSKSEKWNNVENRSNIEDWKLEENKKVIHNIFLRSDKNEQEARDFQDTLIRQNQ